MHKFEKACPNWRFEIIQPENLAAARDFFLAYEGQYAKESDLAREEARKVLEVLEHYEAYGMLGGMLLGAVSYTHLDVYKRQLKGKRWICCTTHFVQDHCSLEELEFAYDLITKLARE